MEGQTIAGLALVLGAVGGFALGSIYGRPAKRNNSIHFKLNHIMGQIDDLKAEVAGAKEDLANLQATVDAEQAQLAALLETNAGVVTALNQKISDLEDQLAEAQDPTVLQEAIDGLKEIRASIVTAREDIQTTVADEPAEPGEGEPEEPTEPETPTV